MRIQCLLWVCVLAVLAIGCDSGKAPGSDGGASPDLSSGGGAGDGGSTTVTGQIFPADNPWNTDISGEPVDPGSDAYITSIGSTRGLHPDFSSVAGGNFGIPFVVVPGTQKMVPITFTLYPTESDPGPYPLPDNAPIEPSGDGHVIAVDMDNGLLYELFQGSFQNGMWNAANGAKFNLRSNATRPAGWTSADAAGLPVFPGLARYSEVAAGEIKHALRFTVSTSQKAYVAPALHAAGSSSSASTPPMGLRLRLKASVNLASYGPQAKAILTALKKYGMIVADNGSDFYISGAPDAGWDDDDLAKLSQIKGSMFEVVKHGTLTPYP